MATWGPTNIAADADDGCGYSTSGWIADQLYFGANVGSYNYSTGMRWALAVPQGATISSATLQVCEADYLGTLSNIHGRMYADDVDNGGSWGTGDVDAQITKTTAYTDVDPASWSNGTWRNIDVTAIVQEIVSRGSWSSGNYIRFGLLNDGTTGSGNQAARFYSHDQYSAAYSPNLTVVYTEGGGSTSVAVFMNQYRQRRQ